MATKNNDSYYKKQSMIAVGVYSYFIPIIFPLLDHLNGKSVVEWISFDTLLILLTGLLALPIGLIISYGGYHVWSEWEKYSHSSE